MLPTQPTFAATPAVLTDKPIASITVGMNTQAYLLLQLMSLRTVALSVADYITTSPYSNCRECGFGITLRRGVDGKSMTMVFYEHRNSDELCCVRWGGTGNITGGLTPDDIPTAVFPNKAAYSHSVDYMDFSRMLDYVQKSLEQWLAGTLNSDADGRIVQATGGAAK